MKKTVVTRNIIQLTRWPLLFPVNVALVNEDDGITLVDAAMPGSDKAILEAAGEMGAPIKRIVLTHTDSDHIGALDELAGMLPGVEVLMTSRAAQLLSGDFSQSPEEAALGNLGRFRKSAKTGPTDIVRDGDMIGSLQVVESPGHAPDHIALLDTRDGTLLAGDAFQTRGGMAVAGVIRPAFPFPGIFTWNKALALESAIRLRELNPTRLVVGHGDPLDEPQAAMDLAIDVASRKLGRSVTHAT